MADAFESAGNYFDNLRAQKALRETQATEKTVETDVVADGGIQCDIKLQETFGSCSAAPPKDQLEFANNVNQFIEWQNWDKIEKNDAGAPIDKAGDPMQISAESLEMLEKINDGSLKNVHPIAQQAYDQVLGNPASFGVEIENNGLIERGMGQGLNDFNPISSI